MISFTCDINVLRDKMKNACEAFDENIQPQLKGIYLKVSDGFIDIASNAFVISYYNRLRNVKTSGTGILFLPVTIYNLIDSLKDTAYTKITDVSIVEGDKHVNVLATEQGIDDTPYAGFTQQLSFTVAKNPLKNPEKLDFGLLDRGTPESVEQIPVSEFKLVADMFLPLFGKNDFQAQRSYLFLGKKLFMVNAFMTAYSDNIFGIEDKSINNKLLSFIRSIIGEDSEGTVTIWEQDRKLYCEYNDNYIVFNFPKVEHLSIDHVLDPSTEEKGVLLPMEMLLALFQRSSALTDKSWIFDFNEQYVHIRNKELNDMKIPVAKWKNLTGRYSVEIEHLNKALILKKAEYVILYVYESNNSVRMKVMDTTKLWAGDIPIKR